MALYDAYMPQALQVLDTLDAVLTKAETHAREKGLDADAEYLGARLYDDMNPLTFQVLTVSRLAKASITNLTGAAPEEWPGEESLRSFADLHARVDKTRALLKAATPDQFNGREEEQVEMKLGPAAFNVKVKAMLFQLVQPNLFFHLVTTYNILRSKGVPLGKIDYLAAFAGDILPRPPPAGPKP